MKSPKGKVLPPIVVWYHSYPEVPKDILRLGLKPYKRWQFFKNIIPSYNLKIDPDSYHFYQAEDWEMLLLQTGQSPFSRRKVKETEEDAEDEDFGL